MVPGESLHMSALLEPHHRRSKASPAKAPETRSRSTSDLLARSTRQELDICPVLTAKSLLERIALVLESEEVVNRQGYTAIEDCTGGAYIIGNDPIAVFKPVEQEPYSPGNNKGYTGASDLQPFGIKAGILPGEGGIREVAAWLLDRRGFASVPTTVMSRVRGLGAGSLQRYIDHEGFAEDFGPSIFPTLEVQKIAVLDIRIANLDRHGGNLLVSKGTGRECRLTPIDHALSLPQWDRLDDIWLEWLSWPQARAPLTEHVHQYINGFNGHTDAHMLVQLGIRPECAVTVRITTLLLQIGVNAGLTLGLIGAAMVRPHRDEPSQLESMVEAAVRLTGCGPLGQSPHCCATCGTSTKFFVELAKQIVKWTRTTTPSKVDPPAAMRRSTSLQSFRPVHHCQVF